MFTGIGGNLGYLLLLSALNKLPNVLTIDTEWLRFFPDLAPRRYRHENISLSARWLTLAREAEKAQQELESSRQDYELLRQDAQVQEQLVELDLSILVLLPSLGSAEKREEKLKRLLRELLNKAITVFGGDTFRTRTWIFRRDPEDEDWLIPWLAPSEVEQENADRQAAGQEPIARKFFVGDAHAVGHRYRRGVAGEVFLSRELRIISVNDDEEADWEVKDDDYITFDAERSQPPYRTFAAVPIVRSNECIGVFCVDTMKIGAFDPERVQVFLRTIGLRIMTVMNLYQELSE